MSRRAEPWSVRLHRRQQGGASAEHIAILIVVGSVVAALVAVPIAPTVGTWARYAACQLFSDDCQRPGLDDNLDLADCEVSRRSGSFEYEASAFSVGYSNEVGFDTVLNGDGTVEVSYVRGEDVDVGVGVGAEVWIYTGDGEMGAGATASADISVFNNYGDVYGFSNLEDAEEFVAWTRANKGVIDAMPVVGSDTPVVGWTAGKIHEAFNGGLNIVGWGQDKPPEPEIVGSWEEGGVELSGQASAGVRDGQEDDLGALLHGEIAAVASNAVKHYRDHQTGQTTFYLSAEASIEGTGELASLGVDFAAGESGVVALTVDSDNNPVELTTHSYRVDDAGRDLDGVTDRDAIDRRFGTATASGDLAEPSMYEITTSINLRDDPELAAAVLGPADPTLAGDIEAAVEDQGAFTTVAEYELDDGRYGFGADLGALLEFSGGASVNTERSDLRNAWAYDPAFGSYGQWVSCANAAP